MSFSPRPRPHTTTLAFSDTNDVTDTYADEATSRTSSPFQRHPRGDTPLSRPQQSASDYSSPGRWTVTSNSERGGAGRDEQAEEDSGQERSNLDKLLDFLDEDDAPPTRQGEQHLRSPRTTSSPRPFAIAATPPPPVPSTSRPPPPPTTVRRAPTSSFPSRHSPVPSSPASSTSRGSDSPSLRAHHRSLSSISASHSHAQTQHSSSALARLNRSGDGGRAGLPDSPSPRPGSVAALRKNGEASFLSAGERSGVSAGVGQRTARMEEGVKGKGRADERREEERYEPEGGEDEGEETEGGESLDSVARVAQAAMDEFDTIISHGIASSSRSASRLRNIPSPVRTPTPPAPNGASSPPSQSLPAQYHSPSPPPNLQSEELNAHLVRELREAQDYISMLQDELRNISEVVTQLREHPEPPLPSLPNGYQRSADRGFAGGDSTRTNGLPPTANEDIRAKKEQVVLEHTGEAALEVVKHLVSLLPSLSLSSSSPPPTVDSLALALAFTRRFDQLAHHSPHLRRDEDVFEQENLEGVLRRVKGWERAARDV